MTFSPAFSQLLCDFSRSSILPLIAAAAVCIPAFEVRAEEYYGAWLQRYSVDSLVSQGGTATAVDSRGNVAVTGYTFVGGSRKVYYTAKYEGGSGLLIWERIYDSDAGESIAKSVAVDSAGNVIVTGASVGAGTNFDYVTIKYDANTGADLWAQPLRFNGPSSGSDEALKVLVDSSDNIVVTGRSSGSGTNYDICTIKYSPAGVALWGAPARYNSASNRDDRPLSMVIDGSSNTIIVGEADQGSETKFVTLKYAAATGALSWPAALYSSPGAVSFYGGTGVAVDSAGNIYSAGIATQANSRRLYHLLKYTAAGAFLWQQTGLDDIDSPGTSPVYVGTDTSGNAIVSCTSEDATGSVSIQTVKHAAAGGNVLWSARTPAPGDNDVVRGQVVDGASNTIIIGESTNEDRNLDYYVAKYASTGELLFEGAYNGDFGGTGGTDIPLGVAVDGNSNTIIVGESTADLKGSGRQRMVTIKLSRFIAFSGDEVQGADDAKFKTIGTPAISGTGSVVAKVTIAAGKKKVAAIFAQGAAGDTTLPAVQNEEAPGINGAFFKSFADPVLAPNGRYAFTAKLGGVKSSESTTVWTNLVTGTLHSVLQQGQEIPGIQPALKVKSITSISLRDASLLALIKVSGDDVNKANDTVLLRHSAAGNNVLLLRTGEFLGSPDPENEIKGITVLSPAKGTPGQGRWHADNRVVARVTLADKRSVVVNVSLAGSVTPLLTSGAPATGLGTGAIWKSFGFPAVGGTLGRFAAQGVLARGEGGVDASNDTALVYSGDGGIFTPFAREGDTAPGSSSATYGGFLDPVVNAEGSVAFIASLKGKNVKGANSAIYWGAPGAIVKVARTGDPAPDAFGESDDARWTGFLSVALPSGAGSGPIFVAKLGGKGVNGKNNLGVWAVNSAGTEVRQIIRTGDQLGRRTISRLSLLQALPGSFGAARSYNATGSITLLVTFTDRTQGIVNLGIP